MSDTPLALAQYLGVSKGTASQSVLVLQNKRLIEKSADENDRRVVHLRLTTQGRKALAHFGQQAGREQLVVALGAAVQDSTEQALTTLLKGLLAQQGGKSFGVCHSCRHFVRAGGAYRCGLIGVPLSGTESEQICHEHQYP
jgi:DNA-binding MarR family transcriptional regulator